MQSEVRSHTQDRTTLIYVTLMVPLGVIFAEIMAIYYSSAIGLVSYSLLMQMIFAFAAINWNNGLKRFFLVLSLIPVLRILSLSMPLAGLDTIYWYTLMGIPLLLTCVYIMRTLEIKWWQVGIRFEIRRLPYDLLLALGGIAVAIGLYRFEPPPLAELPGDFVLLGFHVLVWVLFVAGMEELIFRGIILHGLRQLWGSAILNSIYIALLYTILNINYGSGVFLAIVFGFSLILNVAANAQPRSILGTILAHGLLNVVYFVILPLARL